ncbi:MAG: DUF6428 family protein [Pseudomonadota bacterium]
MAETKTLDGLLSTLQQLPQQALVFAVGERRVSPGFHVTELKSSAIRSVDCGQATDAWQEAVLQILEGSDSCVGKPMTVEAFTRIINAGRALLADPVDGRLVIEIGGRDRPLQRHVISNVATMDAHETVVTLTAETASCKAATRALSMFVDANDGAKRGRTQTSVGCCGARTPPAPAKDQQAQRASCCA